jgi:signal recognition particle receptor subunit beta
MEYLYIVLCVVPLLFLLLLFKRKTVHPEILLYGPANSGKTRLFYMVLPTQLTEGTVHATVSSMKCNSATYLIGSKLTTLIDFPGHHYFYQQLLAKAPTSLGMVFLLDSTDKQAFKKAAEELYELMALRAPREILVFCNKQDLPFAKKILMIESELSTEM